MNERRVKTIMGWIVVFWWVLVLGWILKIMHTVAGAAGDLMRSVK